MHILVKYGDELLKFNLNDELIISEERINSEIKDQPSAYGFLGLLHKKLVRIMKDKEMELKKEYSRLYILYKEKKDATTGRPFSDTFVDARIIINLKYQVKFKEFVQAEEDASSIEVCIKAFEQRANMVQTLSANIRKDRS